MYVRVVLYGSKITINVLEDESVTIVCRTLTLVTESHRLPKISVTIHQINQEEKAPVSGMRSVKTEAAHALSQTITAEG